MDEYLIPLIIRGKVIESDLISLSMRRDLLSIRTPNLQKFLRQLPLRDPVDQSDLYALSMDEIIVFLEDLGSRLALEKNPRLQTAMELALKVSHQTYDMSRKVFSAMPQMLRRDAILEFVERNIGRSYLDGWVDEEMSDRRVAVRAFGARSVHVIAGNVPVVALLTVLINAVTRGDAIIKIPSNDPYTAAAIALTMIEMAPDHPITRHLSVAYWKGGDADIEGSLYDPNNVEKIVAWGGFNSMRSIRNYLVPGIDLVAMDPKISGSIIGAEAFQSAAALRDAAEKAAWDVGHFNQSGCANARTLYIVSGTDEAGIERANQFGSALFEALQNLPVDTSSHHPAFDAELKGELDGIRYTDSYRLFGGRESEGAVIVSQADEEVDFSAKLDCRVANLVPVDSLDAAVRHVTIHMQTIGVYPDRLKAVLRDRCALRGAQRIVSLGQATSATFVGPWDAMEPVRRMVRWLRDDTISGRSGYLHG